MCTVLILDFSAVLSKLELLVVPIITMVYLFNSKNKTIFFSLFFITYAVSDIFNLIDGESLYEPIYFVCNGLYVVAYIFLLIEILNSMNINNILKNFLFQFLVLIILAIYLFVVLYKIVTPLTFETNTINLVRFVEHVYNLVLLFILVTSFLNYLEKETTKSLLFFLACLSIVFSELLLIGYYYLLEKEILNYSAIILNVLAFILFYYQSKLKYKEVVKLS